MVPILAYIIVVSVCISVFYLFYRLFLHKDTDFKAVRLYLISAVIISFILPGTNLSVNLNLPSVGTAEYFSQQPEANVEWQEDNTEVSPVIITPPASESAGSAEMIPGSPGISIPWVKIVILIYLLGFAFLLVRLIKQIIVICACFFRSEKRRDHSLFIIRNSTFDFPFSFFNWIFIPYHIEPGHDMDEIVQHEKIHAGQWHSADMLVTEMLTATMWFNPLIWIMKNSVQLVHEYLADEGVLKKGLDKVFYQALLVNQAAESKLIPLSSRFNQSLIKKRITMMSKTKSNPLTKLKLFGIIPIIGLLVIGIACAKTQDKQKSGEQDDNIVTAIQPTKMNVLYLGVENPVAVAVSGYNSADLEVEIDNGMIEGQDGVYVAMPARAGEANITVMADGKKVGSMTFRVKYVPDPLPRVGVKNYGPITKNEIIEAGGLNAYIPIDFDIQFKVVSFGMSTPNPSGFVVKANSDTDRFSEKQIEIINSLVKDQRLFLEEIRAIGPDGTIRNLPDMAFTISE
jgi:hypothetical protein